MHILGNKDELLKRLEEYTNKINDCWLWIGYLTTSGYGRITIHGMAIEIHRLSCYIHHDLDLSDDRWRALHKTICPNKSCWNPEHLYIGTQFDNMRDSISAGTHISQNQYRTHCKYGHLIDGIKNNGKRYCLTCNRERDKKYKRETKERMAQVIRDKKV
jgi:hypothetical protein